MKDCGEKDDGCVVFNFFFGTEGWGLWGSFSRWNSGDGIEYIE